VALGHLPGRPLVDRLVEDVLGQVGRQPPDDHLEPRRGGRSQFGLLGASHAGEVEG